MCKDLKILITEKMLWLKPSVSIFLLYKFNVFVLFAEIGTYSMYVHFI